MSPLLPVTWLYVPGDRPERFGKAVESGADVVIIDLEDAVAPVKKDEARQNAVTYLRDRRNSGGVEVHVRVNDPATARGRDDLAAVGQLADAVRLPKVESAAVLDTLTGAPAYALLESAAGIVAAREIARTRAWPGWRSASRTWPPSWPSPASRR